MSSCVHFGKLDKNFYFLLLTVLFKLLCNLVYGISNTKEFGDPLYIHESIFLGHKLLLSIIRFFGITVLSFVYYKYESDKINSTTSNIKYQYYIKSMEKSDSSIPKNEKSKFLLIHNEIGINNSKYIPQLLIIGFLLGFSELLRIYYYSVAKQDTNYWPFEILCTSFFINKIFKTKSYKHQKFSVLFIVISCNLMKLLSYMQKNSVDSFNKKLLFDILFYLLTVLMNSYAYTKAKWLIDIRCFPISKILIVYGLFGFFISLIIHIFTMIFPCFISEALEKSFSQPYSFNRGYFIIEIILVVAYMFLNFFAEFYNMLSLKIFSPVIILTFNSVYCLLIQLILVIKNGIRLNQ